MFVLHYIDQRGKPNGVVHQRDTDGIDGPDFASHHAATARVRAHQAAVRAECNVQVSREVGGALRPAYVMTPYGNSMAPPGMQVPEREACNAESGQPCFCSACRAKRRNDREKARREALRNQQ